MSKKIRRHVYILGRVQGVGFRASVKRKAQQLNIKGWVKNLFDGRVEAVFSGEKGNVKEIINYVRKGPRFAEVENVEIYNESYNGKFGSFYIDY